MPRMQGFSVWAAVALAVGGGVIPRPRASRAGETAARADCDAAFVEMAVPAKVITDQVFLARITLRNTGTATWRCTGPAHLRSLEPPLNANWGTSIVRTGQGAVVKPGDVYTFTSYLKAPARPGKVVFRWRLARGEAFFGEPTAARAIQVGRRPVKPAPAPAPAPQGPPGKHVLNRADFEYAGSFKLPGAVKGARATWSEGGIALRPAPDGAWRLFVNYTHPAQVLFEQVVEVKLNDGVETPRRFGDYRVMVRADKVPAGVEFLELPADLDKL